MQSAAIAVSSELLAAAARNAAAEIKLANPSQTRSLRYDCPFDIRHVCLAIEFNFMLDLKHYGLEKRSLHRSPQHSPNRKHSCRNNNQHKLHIWCVYVIRNVLLRWSSWVTHIFIPKHLLRMRLRHSFTRLSWESGVQWSQSMCDEVLLHSLHSALTQLLD